MGVEPAEPDKVGDERDELDQHPGRGGPAGGKLVMSGRRLAARLDFRSGPARWVRMARRI